MFHGCVELDDFKGIILVKMEVQILLNAFLRTGLGFLKLKTVLKPVVPQEKIFKNRISPHLKGEGFSRVFVCKGCRAAGDSPEDLDGVRAEGIILQVGLNVAVNIVEANFEKMPILESERALTFMNLYGLNVDALCVNKVIPENVDDPYFTKWKETQKEYMERIENTFYPLKIFKIYFFNIHISS